jgi:hypothetical protein
LVSRFPLGFSSRSSLAVRRNAKRHRRSGPAIRAAEGANSGKTHRDPDGVRCRGRDLLSDRADFALRCAVLLASVAVWASDRRAHRRSSRLGAWAHRPAAGGRRPTTGAAAARSDFDNASGRGLAGPDRAARAKATVVDSGAIGGRAWGVGARRVVRQEIVTRTPAARIKLEAGRRPRQSLPHANICNIDGLDRRGKVISGKNTAFTSVKRFGRTS